MCRSPQVKWQGPALEAMRTPAWLVAKNGGDLILMHPLKLRLQLLMPTHHAEKLITDSDHNVLYFTEFGGHEMQHICKYTIPLCCSL